MSPEAALKHVDIMERSKELEPELLEIEREAQRRAHEAREESLMQAAPIEEYEDTELASPDLLACLVDTRIATKKPVISPETLANKLPVTAVAAQTTLNARRSIGEILRHEDDRLLVVVGPCSIHDPKDALKYADHVRLWRTLYGQDLEIVMRAYVEKPRTELGWKGLVLQPELNKPCNVNLGVIVTRMLVSQIANKGVPVAMERLNALTPQYVNGLVAYDAIGARNTTDQKAREYGSGTSSPVGFKNTPEGSIMAAAEAVVAAAGHHSFLGMGLNGTPHQIDTGGNDLGHIILRGDTHGPNYSHKHIEKTKQIMEDKQILPSIVVDASHGNSQKRVKGELKKVAEEQIEVVDQLARCIALGERAVVGFMIESNLAGGKQDIDEGRKNGFEPGKSITDACVDLAQTREMLSILAAATERRRHGQL